MKTKIIIYIFVFVGLFFPVGGYFINHYYHKKVKNSPKMYVYQTFWGPANSVLIIENLKYKNALIAYYDTIENSPKANPIFEFPLKTLPTDEPVYVVGYTEDSSLADVVSYYDRGAKFGGNYLRCWVYIKTLHKNPPIKNDNSKREISEQKESKSQVVKFDNGIWHSKYSVSKLFGEWGYDQTNPKLIMCIDSLAFTVDKAQKISFPYKIVYDTITVYQNIDGKFPTGIITLNKSVLTIKWINGGGATNEYRKITHI